MSVLRALQKQWDKCWGSGSGIKRMANHFSAAKTAAIKPGCQIKEKQIQKHPMRKNVRFPPKGKTISGNLETQ